MIDEKSMKNISSIFELSKEAKKNLLSFLNKIF